MKDNKKMTLADLRDAEVYTLRQIAAMLNIRPAASLMAVLGTA